MQLLHGVICSHHERTAQRIPEDTSLTFDLPCYVLRKLALINPKIILLHQLGNMINHSVCGYVLIIL